MQINHGATVFTRRHIVVDRVAFQVQCGGNSIADVGGLAYHFVHRNVAAEVIAAAGSQLGKLLSRVNSIWVIQRCAGGVKADNVAIALSSQTNAVTAGNNSLLVVFLYQFPAIVSISIVQLNSSSVILVLIMLGDLLIAVKM